MKRYSGLLAYFVMCLEHVRIHGIAYCKKYMEKNKYDAIYLATEERKTRDLFKKEFPGKILENKRRYYDDIYDKDSSIVWITQWS